MDLTLKLLVVIGSLLTLFECSRPKRTSVRRWTGALLAGLKRIRQPNDLRRAAISMYIIDRRLKNLMPATIRAISLPFQGKEGIRGVLSVTVGLAILCIPLLMLLTAPSGIYWVTLLQIAGVGGVISIIANLAVIVSGVQLHPDPQGYVSFKGKPRVFSVPAVLLAVPYGAQIVSWKPLVVRYFMPHMIISGVLIAFVILASLPLYLRHALSLEPVAFLYYFSIPSVIAILIYFSLIFSFILQRKGVKGNKPHVGTLTLWTVSLYAITTLTYICMQKNAIFTELPLVTVFVFFLSDIYTIFLFNRLVRGIIFVRRRGLAISAVLLREYALFVIRTAVAAYLAIVVVLLVQPAFKENIWESALYIFLMYDFAGGEWMPAQATLLTHTAFIPLFILLTIPMVMIVHRLLMFLIYVFGVNIVRNSNPIAYVAAVLFLLTAVADVFFGLI
jgi:hypothetical protein